MVYIASTTFTGNRPIVYAYGILASEMKINDSHSRVLKLHGDFLYSNIVNTDDEMDAKSNAINTPGKDAREIISHLNMERQVRTVLDNFGLIVVGYAGGDGTIMKLLEQVSEHNGLYWCYIKDYPPDEDVLKLVKSKNGKLVEITGFDDMMKEIADVTNFSIDDLLASFERRKETLVERITKFNDDYTKKSLGKYANELTEKQKDNPSENLSAVDYLLLGNKADDDGNSTLAEENYRKAIELNPSYADAYYNLGNLFYKDETRWQEAEENYHKAIELDPNHTSAYSNLGVLLDENLINLKEAEENYRKAIELDPNDSIAYNNLGALFYKQEKIDEAIKNLQISAQLDENFLLPRLSLASIYKKLDNKKESDKYIGQVKEIIKDDDYYYLAYVNSILDNKEEAFKFLRLAIDKDSFLKRKAKRSISLEWLQDDKRFWEIVGGDE